MRTNVLLSTLIAVTVSLASCGGGSGEGDGNGADSTQVEAMPEVLQRGTTTLNLSEYYMPFSLIIPDSMRGYPEVMETGYGETVVTVGPTYNMLIAEGGDMATKKADLSSDIMYTNTIVEEGENYVLFKSEIKDSFLDPEFHFYALKTVNGIQYEFKDNKDEGPYAESVARFMLESVKHLQPNKEAS